MARLSDRPVGRRLGCGALTMGKHAKGRAEDAFQSAPEAGDSDSCIAEWFRQNEETVLEALAALANK